MKDYNIIIDFGNLIEEMKNMQVKLCLIHNRPEWFVIDNQNQLYQIETYYCGGYLDKYIREKLHIEFNLVPMCVCENIEEWEKDIWGIDEVKKFIDRQHLNDK